MSAPSCVYSAVGMAAPFPARTTHSAGAWAQTLAWKSPKATAWCSTGSPATGLDATVKANGSISPIHSYSWVGGLEIAPSKVSGLYFYYSGVYAQKNATVNSDGTCCVGYGYPGANTNADRSIQEITGGYSRVVWKFENVGSVQWGAQYAYELLNPWVAGTGPNSAHANMIFGQLRYNLP